jgi:hypothetical protein
LPPLAPPTPLLDSAQPFRSAILELKLASDVEIRLAMKLRTSPIHPPAHFFIPLVCSTPIDGPFRPKMLALLAPAS